jgi:hypothetical protein
VYVPYDNPPGSDIIIIGGDYRWHWTAHVARGSSSYLRKHHRWVIGTLVAIAAIIVTALS